MTSGMQKAPANVNEAYNMAANWIKTQPVNRPGHATMFVDKHDGKTEKLEDG